MDCTTFKSGEELYSLSVEGDESAFEELVKLYRKGLTRYIYSFVNDAREAEELMIDAFAELIAGAGYKGRSSIKTYIFAIGRNIALRHVKKYRRIGVIPIEEIADEAVSFSDLPETDFIREDERSRLFITMRKLKQEYREVLYLIYFEEMSYSDAGAAMRKTVSQVKNLAHQAKLSFRNIMESEGAGNEKRQGSGQRGFASG